MIVNYKNMDELFEEIFGQKPSKRGKGFEMLTGAVLKIINEARDVTHDVKRLGLYSSDFYQIDVLVDDNQEMLFVEAKDYSETNNKTGRGDAQKLAGALNNLNIDKGLLVSATGFTKPTIQYSKSTKLNPNAKEINLCLLRPTINEDTKNLILEIVVNAFIQSMDESKSKTNILINPTSLKQTEEEWKAEGVKEGYYETRINEFFDKTGKHIAYVSEIITTKLPYNDKGEHKGVWRPNEETYVKIMGKLLKIDGVEYEFAYITNKIDNFVHIKEEPVLTVKSEDLNIDYIITKRQLSGIIFESDGNIIYKECSN